MHSSNVVAAWVLAANDELNSAAERSGAGLRELSALTLIATHADATGDWLRARVGLSQPGTVRLIDRLADAGLVERSVRHGRSVGLTVTPRGRRLLRRWSHERDTVVDSLTGALGEGDKGVLTGLLASLLRSVDRQRREADTVCRTCDWPACGDGCPVDESVRP